MYAQRNLLGLFTEFKNYLKKPTVHNKLRFKNFQAVLRGDSRFYDLHQKFYAALKECRKWEGYDYNEGFFYQSFPRAKLNGLRDSQARIDAYNLREEVGGKKVLDIGCNLGFLDCELSDSIKRLDGFDINPYLIKVANISKNFFNIKNCTFSTTSFEKFEPQKESYEVIFSFANHSTYDGKTRYSLEEYFAKISSLLDKDGILLLESHAPAYENNFSNVIDLVRERFIIIRQLTQITGSYLDKGRTFLKCQKK